VTLVETATAATAQSSGGRESRVWQVKKAAALTARPTAAAPL
jgi:hypothetical protein